MKINNNIHNRNTQNFKGIWNNKTVLKGLETISEHSTTFVAATTLAMATVVRPIAISVTPNTNKETKKYASVNSIASGITKFALVEALAIPVENAVKKIDKNPETYLNKETISNLKGKAELLTQSENYNLATQIFKMGTGLITAIPKSMITVALIPVILKGLKFLKKPKEIKDTKTSGDGYDIYREYNPVFSDDFDFNSENNKNISFKGTAKNPLASVIGNMINNKTFQNCVKKYSPRQENIARNVSMATDILLTTSFIHRINKSKDIEQERKKPLIVSNVISTGATLLAGFSLDSFVKKGTKGFIDKFSEINKNDPKLSKYIEGINIIRPTIIFGIIYYGLLPIVSTYISDKTNKKE